MKQILFFIAALLLLISTVYSQTWIGLTRNESTEPEIVLTNSNNQTVSFTVGLSGFFSTIKTEGGINYQRLFIPGGSKTGETGNPEIPVISQRIAVPVCSQIDTIKLLMRIIWAISSKILCFGGMLKTH